jgi:PAS domain S-box-containing protein
MPQHGSFEPPLDLRALRAQAQLIELAAAAVLVRELGTGVILFWNRGAEEVYGWTRAEALGRVSHELLKTEFPQPLAHIEAGLSQHGQWAGELGHTTRDGRHIVVASRWAVARSDLGEPAAYLEVNIDITERKRAEEQLRALADQLARTNAALQAAHETHKSIQSMLAHDLKAPLANVAWHTQVLNRRYRQGRLDPDAIAELVQGISLNVTDAMSVVDELRHMSSAEGTGETLRRERISLLRLTREVVAAGPLGDRPHVRVEGEAATITVETNRAQLNRALANLLDNAAKYTPPDREIVVRIAAEQIDGSTWAVFEVKDHGIGIPVADLPHVFDSHHRGANAAHIPGEGVGLASVKRFVDHEGGALDVKSVEGQGSTFTLRLPRSLAVM